MDGFFYEKPSQPHCIHFCYDAQMKVQQKMDSFPYRELIFLDQDSHEIVQQSLYTN